MFFLDFMLAFRKTAHYLGIFFNHKIKKSLTYPRGVYYIIHGGLNERANDNSFR